MKTKKIFYGWYIVFACLLIAATNIGFHNTASLFIRPVTEDLGFSRGAFTLFRTLTMLFGALTLPYFSKLSNKYSVKKIMLFGTTLNSITLGALAFANNIWQFYAIGLASGLVMNAGTFMIIAILLNRWFEDKKGLAIGLAFAGSGVGAAIMNPAVNLVIENLGWRSAFIFSATLATVVLIPTILFVIKDSPSQMGLAAYTDPSKTKDTNNKVIIEEKSMTLKEARKTPTFWLLAFALLGFSVGASAPNTHSVAFMIDIGYSQTIASNMITVTMIFLTMGKILMGHLFDRFGTFKGGLMLCTFAITSPIFALLSQVWVGAPWLHGIALGIASTGFSIPANIYIPKFFGKKNFAAILAAVSVITTLAAAVAPPIMGLIYDTLGTYLLAWYALIVFAILVTISLFAADIINQKKKTLL